MNQLSNSEEVLKNGLSAETSRSLNELSQSFDKESKDLEDLYEEWEILHQELEKYTD